MSKPCTRCGGIKAPGQRLRICEACRSQGYMQGGRWRPPLPGDTRTLDKVISAQSRDMRDGRSSVKPYVQRFADDCGERRPVLIHHGMSCDEADRQGSGEWDDPVFDAVWALQELTLGHA